jgi:predicted O-methyltransferase YrrM
MHDIEYIMTELDKWVEKRGCGSYINTPVSDGSLCLEKDWGIQQNREEIKKFIEILLNHNRLDSILEIGLGSYGSTHFIWRMIFNNIITIEYQKERVFTFRENMFNFFSHHELGDQRSFFLYGMSYMPKVIKKVYDLEKNINLLFIDGNHDYESVLSDWLLYEPIVSSGGIVAFHDSLSNSGVPIFLDNLKQGKFNGKKIDMNRVSFSDDLGIDYYIKK